MKVQFLNRYFVISVAIITLNFIFGCQDASMSGGADTARRSSNSTIKKCDPNSKTCNTDPPVGPIGPVGPTPPGGLLSEDGGGVCLTGAPNIDFIFAMDVSGSMQSQSNKVNAAFAALTQTLQNISIPGIGKPKQVRFGLVTFEDDIIFESPLSSDAALTQSLINANFRAVERGTDPTEGGLLAASRGLDIAAAGGDGVKVLFVVTDAFAHDGSGSGFLGARGYSTAAIEQALSAANMKLTFIYSATDFSGGSGSGPTFNAVDQWKNIRARAAQIGGHGQLGRDFDVYNFSSSDVSGAIPGDISRGLRKCVR